MVSRRASCVAVSIRHCCCACRERHIKHCCCACSANGTKEGKLRCCEHQALLLSLLLMLLRRASCVAVSIKHCCCVFREGALLTAPRRASCASYGTILGQKHALWRLASSLEAWRMSCGRLSQSMKKRCSFEAQTLPVSGLYCHYVELRFGSAAAVLHLTDAARERQELPVKQRCVQCESCTNGSRLTPHDMQSFAGSVCTSAAGLCCLCVKQVCFFVSTCWQRQGPYGAGCPCECFCPPIVSHGRLCAGA